MFLFCIPYGSFHHSHSPCKLKMKDILHKNVVLVLNRNWQAISTTTPAQAFSQMMTDAATGEWRDLAVREEDLSIGICNGQIRVPTILVLCRYNKVPIYIPKLNSKNIWIRDRGICQYSGRPLRPSEGNIDHVIPVSKGGANTWENCVLSCKQLNQKKADKTPNEAGMRLIRKPTRPKPVPITATLRNLHGMKDWSQFLLT